MTLWEKVQSYALISLECIPVRLVVGFLGFFGFINMYMVRFNLSIIAVAMIKKNHSRDEHCIVNSPESGCGGNSTEEFVTTDTVEWSEATTGLVMSFFYYGYIVTQLPGGRLAEIVGTKRVFGTAIFASGVLTLLSPFAVRWHPAAMCALRFIMGLALGVTWPAMHALTVRWIPQQQRPRFMSVVYIASTLGVVLTMPLCGFVIETFSWDAAFYVTGSLSIIWAIFWALLVFDNPEDHPRIKQEELDFILANVRSTGTSEVRLKKVPWKSILKSFPFWAIIAAECGNAFGLTILLTQYPNFLDSVYHYSVSKNSLMSVTPFLARYIGATLFSLVADYLVVKELARITVVRKIFSAIAMLGPALMTVLIIILWSNMSAVLFLVAAGMFFNGAASSSILVNYTDIAPNFAGTLLGIGNTAGNISASIAPLLAGLLIPDKSPEQWRNVFWTVVPFYVITELVFLVLASGIVQPWNYHGTEKDTKLIEKTNVTKKQDV